MRGEHFELMVRGELAVGSSPHARGTPVQQPVQGDLGRFIPACAGNTIGMPSTNWLVSVHPRMRGEHFPDESAPTHTYGSSPHARGTQWVDLIASTLRRFIPACAGNTGSRRVCAGSVPVHPRMRGEHKSAARFSLSALGSSPHARGTRFRDPCGLANVRFIPACAGNTSAAARSTPTAAVHPRMRGEHAFPSTSSAWANGSSPHARGTLGARLSSRNTPRFIPACAGNTMKSRSATTS